MSFRPVGEQSSNEFGNQVVSRYADIRVRGICRRLRPRSDLYQGLEQYTVGTPVRIHDQPSAVTVVGDEVGGGRRFGRSVHQESNDGINLRRRARIVRED